MTERTIFLAAIDIHDQAERVAYLDQACRGDAELRAQIEQLLWHHAESSQFLEKPAGADSSADEMTIVSHGAGDDDDDQNSSGLSGEAELRKYLQPATRPGWLGRLAHYEIEQILGRGAFGIVVKAFDEKLHRVVAIKLMNPDLASTSPPRKRFLREARTAAAVRNEYIVGIHAVEEEPLPYLVMEYVPGMTLQQRLDQDGPLELSEILRIGQQVAAGMAAAHAANLIHRDIKPSNILLEGGVENRAKISDFGLARAVDDASLTSSGLIAGTPMYMAPEQARGEVLDHRADLFSLGSVLYQMTSGRPPFRASNTVAVLKRVCEDTPRPIEDVIPGTADWLCSIIMRLLEKKPADRFQTAKEVADLFARCQAELQLNGKVTCVQFSRIRENSDSLDPTFPGSRVRVNSEKALSTSNRSLLDQSAAQPAISQSGTTEQISSRRSEKAALNLPSILYGIMLGMMVLLPILFGKQLSSYVDAWIFPAIPALPPTADSGGLQVGGLEFDGKGDFVSLDGVDWSYPQFTIEAFVTSAPIVDNGTIVHLDNGGDMPEWMSLYDDRQAEPGKRLSGAAIQGKTPFANASAPLTAGVRQHRVLVFDGRYMHYYVNGIWQAKRFAEAREGLMWKMKKLRIGCDGSERQFFQGRIDQVRISRIARYDANFAPVAGLTSDDVTLAFYKFDEGAGEVLKDASGNGYDGKIVGAKWVKSKSGDLTSRPSSPSSEISNLKTEIPAAAPDWKGWPAGAPAAAVAPFNAEQAKQHQEAWAKYLNIPAEFTDKHGTKYVLIPPGEFQMGFSQTELDTLTRELKQAGASEYDLFSASTSAPKHPVRITKPFYMSAHEVTVAEYRSFIDETHYMTTAEQLGGLLKKWSEYLAPGNPDRHPVAGVSWTDAETYCVLRSEQDGVTYRLPSEAEWEYACRAGTTTLWSFGDNPAQISENAVTAPEGTSTQPVGTRKPNPLGLFDMYGNADEWCLDWHTQDFYATCPTDDPINLKTPTDANSGRVARGCGTISLPWQLRSSTRRWDFPSTPVNLKGFRVVITGDLKKAATNIVATGWHGWPADAPAPAISPFDAAQAQQHQEAWAKYLNVPIEYTNPGGMKFRLVPPGEFMMGSSPEEIAQALGSAGDDKLWQETINSEGPRHKVILTKATYVGVHEVTQGQFEHVMGRNLSRFGPMGASVDVIADLDTSSFPVEKVTWDEATQFCMTLGKMDGLSADNAYRLLTDAEWEFSCRAGTTTEYWTGENHQEKLQVAWLYDNSGERTHAVGELTGNPFGLYDVHGNVWEWVQDGWDPTFFSQLQGQLAVDPIVPSVAGAPHVTRGGCWNSSVASCRSASRSPETAAYSGTLIGFRVSLPVEAVRHSLAAAR